MDTLKLVLLAAVLATIVHAEVSYTIGADEIHSEETGIQNQRLIASNGQFPWHATIFVSKEPNKWTSGSGALVTPRIVLTTATNLLLARQVRIYLGSNEFGRGVSVASEISVVHPRFLRTRNPEFDVGIILLKTSITVSNLIQPIRIATENIQLEGQWLRISGFAPNSSERLRWTELVVARPDICRKFFTKLTPCARNVGLFRGATGDVGAPIVRKTTSGIELIGLNVGAPSEAQAQRIVGFVNLAPHKEWLRLLSEF